MLFHVHTEYCKNRTRSMAVCHSKHSNALETPITHTYTHAHIYSPVLRASFILTAQNGASAIGENVPRSQALKVILRKGAMATPQAQPKKDTDNQNSYDFTNVYVQ